MSSGGVVVCVYLCNLDVGIESGFIKCNEHIEVGKRVRCGFYFMCECDVIVYMRFVIFWEPNIYYVEGGVCTYDIVAIFIDIMTKGTYSHSSWDSGSKKSIVVKDEK